VTKPEYTITYSRAALNALTEKLPTKIAAAAFEFIEGPLKDNPYRVGKQLAAPLFPMFSARRGDYRILYYVDEDQIYIEITDIAHRANIYRKMG